MSSSKPENPIELKNQIIKKALERQTSSDPFDVIANLGDPMIPLVAGIISSASQICNVLLAGGTQMGAIMALAKSTGCNEENIAIGTTSYIVNDEHSNFIKTIKEISDVPILAVNPRLADSKIQGLKEYSNGFVKEGAGAGGTIISAQLKTGLDSKKLLELFEKEYERVSTLQ